MGGMHALQRAANATTPVYRVVAITAPALSLVLPVAAERWTAANSRSRPNGMARAFYVERLLASGRSEGLASAGPGVGRLL